MEYFAKRLDRFLLHEQIMECLGEVHARVISNFLSDHRPITLQWRRANFRHGMPFKFNETWLDDQDFNALVHSLWTCDSDQGPSLMVHILDKLDILPEEVKTWQK